MKPASDVGAVVDDCDAVALQQGGGAYARELKQLWRAYRAAADDDFAFARIVNHLAAHTALDA